MSTSRGSGDGNGGGVQQSIPEGFREIVQSLKEIFECSEAEIYDILKDCNMDPDEAVHRLLVQDPFREVKSKREKKKEGKDPVDPRSRGPNHNSSQGSKISTDRYLNSGGSAPYDSSEYAPLPGKASYDKEHGSASYTSYNSTTDISRNYSIRELAVNSGDAAAEIKGSSLWTTDAAPSGVQPFSGNQPSSSGPLGPVSMADIVKLGKPETKSSNAPNDNVHGLSTSELHQNFLFSEDRESKDCRDSGNYSPTFGDWLSMEKGAPTEVSVPDQEALGVPVNSINLPSEAEDVQEVEDEDAEYSGVSGSISSWKVSSYDSKAPSLFENDLHNNTGFYPHDFDEAEENGASVPSVTRNLQQLNIEKDDRGLRPEGYITSVVIPDHLQVQNVDCSHLCFGSFGPKASKSNSEDPHNEADVSSVGHLDNRNFDGGLFHSRSTNFPSSASRPENAGAVRGNQYSYPSLNPEYTFDDAQAQHLDAPFSQASSRRQNLASFSNVMGYSNSRPRTQSDLRFSQFTDSQSLSAIYGNSASTTGGSTISLSEAGVTSPGHHLSRHPYSQASGPYTNMVGPYTNMVGPYTNMVGPHVPSSAYYHQSLVLPHYDNSVWGGSLPQPPAASSATSYDNRSTRYRDNSHMLSVRQNDNFGTWLRGMTSALAARGYYNYEQPQNQQAGGAFRQVQQQASPNRGTHRRPNFYCPNPRGGSRGGSSHVWR